MKSIFAIAVLNAAAQAVTLAEKEHDYQQASFEHEHSYYEPVTTYTDVETTKYRTEQEEKTRTVPR